MMTRQRILLASLLAACAAVGGCSHFSSTSARAGAYDDVVGWSDRDAPPSGLVFSNGMPPSSQGPSPEWYAKRFSRARGLGEAIKRNHRSLWDRDSGTFVYYMGGILSAHYHPWEHYLEIVTLKKDGNNTVCHWTRDGSLTVGTTDHSPAPAGSEATCRQLLDELAKHVAPDSVLSQSD